MSDDNETTTVGPEAKTEKRGRRKPVFVLVPDNINDPDAEDVAIPPSPEPDEDGKRAKVEPIEFPDSYHVYAVPPGPGQKDAIRAILKTHNVDLHTVQRVRIFTGEKTLKVETQYNIRF